MEIYWDRLEWAEALPETTFKTQRIGLASAELRYRGFSRFSQADDSSTRRFGGSGMGLAIAQHYCDLMGGSIDVQSEPGAGACFTARIPAPLANRVLQVAAAAAAAQTKAMAHA